MPMRPPQFLSMCSRALPNFNPLYMHTFIPTLLTALALLSPSLVLAQVPPPATAGDYPNATPPTKAPTKTLQAAPLPDGQMTAPTVPTVSTTTGTNPTDSSDASVSSNTKTYVVLIGAAILVLAAIGWFLIPRKQTPVEIQTPQV